MGLLRQKLILLLIPILVASCARSIIKYSTKLDDNPYQMFGKIPSREFYVQEIISDSLIMKWENDAYGSFQNSSVSIYDDLVFVNDLSGRVFCFQFDTGKEIGYVKYGGGSVLSTPIVYKNNIVFAVADEGDNVSDYVCYDYNEGKEVRKVEVLGRALTQMIADSSGVYFTTEIGSAYKFAVRGRKIWETHTRIPTRSSPALYDSLFIFGNDNGEIIGLNIESGDSVYAKKIGGSFFSGLTISEDVIYVGNNNGYLYALNYSNGEIIWQFNSKARIFMNPAIDGDNVYFGNSEGGFFSLEKNSGKLNWKVNFRGILDSTPLITQNRIILPDKLFAVHFLDKETGEIKKSVSIGGRAKLTPVIHNNTLFIGFDDGVVRAYEFFK